MIVLSETELAGPIRMRATRLPLAMLLEERTLDTLISFSPTKTGLYGSEDEAGIPANALIDRNGNPILKRDGEYILKR